MNKIELMNYDEFYGEVFKKECLCLQRVLKTNLFEAHHVGSTAIPTIKSRPILDVLVEVHTLDGISLFEGEFNKMGLKLVHSDEECFYLERHHKDGSHLSHIYIYERAKPQVQDMLDFRDYLIAEPKVAKEYEGIKQKMAKEAFFKPGLYPQAKKAFIEIVLNELTK